MAVNNSASLRMGKGPDNETLDGVFALGGDTAVYYDASISSSTDPFAGKTNKYAESRVIRIIAITQGVHALMGDSSVGTATTANGILIPAGSYMDFQVDTDYPYLRVIQNAAGAAVCVVEFY